MKKGTVHVSVPCFFSFRISKNRDNKALLAEKRELLMKKIIVLLPFVWKF